MILPTPDGLFFAECDQCTAHAGVPEFFAHDARTEAVMAGFLTWDRYSQIHCLCPDCLTVRLEESKGFLVEV